LPRWEVISVVEGDTMAEVVQKGIKFEYEGTSATIL
jgi:hypothetical protein